MCRKSLRFSERNIFNVLANLLTKKITDKVEASVVAAKSGADLEQPIWAINWFDLKSSWMYNLYTKLSIGDVRFAGGEPLFKATRIAHLRGNEGLGRMVLVIVKYPSGTAFLDLLSSAMFQIKSVLRRKAVRNFTFGFEEAMDDCLKPQRGEEEASRKLLYLVHHFEGENGQAIIDVLRKNAVGHDIFFQFHGKRKALLGMSRGDRKMKTLPFITDNTLIWAAFENSQLEEFVETELYQKLLAVTANNYLGVFKREL